MASISFPEFQDCCPTRRELFSGSLKVVGLTAGYAIAAWIVPIQWSVSTCAVCGFGSSAFVKMSLFFFNKMEGVKGKKEITKTCFSKNETCCKVLRCASDLLFSGGISTAFASVTGAVTGRWGEFLALGSAFGLLAEYAAYRIDESTVCRPSSSALSETHPNYNSAADLNSEFVEIPL